MKSMALTALKLRMDVNIVDEETLISWTRRSNPRCGRCLQCENCLHEFLQNIGYFFPYDHDKCMNSSLESQLEFMFNNIRLCSQSRRVKHKIWRYGP